jgi:hypothetical protein
MDRHHLAVLPLASESRKSDARTDANAAAVPAAVPGLGCAGSSTAASAVYRRGWSYWLDTFTIAYGPVIADVFLSTPRVHRRTRTAPVTPPECHHTDLVDVASPRPTP